tara:strand:- start:557 stop:1507 length:951 start_codon:yes stop_codon:yes gene_type:complete
MSVSNKTIQSFIIIIIVLTMIFIVLRSNLISNLFSDSKVSLNDEINPRNDIAYLEKIEKFNIKEYSENLLLQYTMTADTYFSYKDSPVKLQKVEVKSYNKSELEGIILNANHAQILQSGEIVFNGEVHIHTKNNVLHELETDSLTYNPDEDLIQSNSSVLYLGENSRINAEGMIMNIDSDKLALNGIVNIVHDSGSTIDSSNLSINHSNGEKIYQSKERTIYRSQENEITADNGLNIDMNKNLTNLLGKVQILEDSGVKIITSNLIVDQSNGGEFYKTDYPTYYKAPKSNINAKKMYYDAILKTIDLQGEVKAVYD